LALALAPILTPTLRGTDALFYSAASFSRKQSVVCSDHNRCLWWVLSIVQSVVDPRRLPPPRRTDMAIAPYRSDQHDTLSQLCQGMIFFTLLCAVILKAHLPHYLIYHTYHTISLPHYHTHRTYHTTTLTALTTLPHLLHLPHYHTTTLPHSPLSPHLQYLQYLPYVPGILPHSPHSSYVPPPAITTIDSTSPHLALALHLIMRSCSLPVFTKLTILLSSTSPHHINCCSI
jgi:hypothetical protein